MEIKNLNNYYDLVHLKFPLLDISDIKRILLFGFKSLYLHNVYGGDVCITDNDFWMYIGYLTNDSIKCFKNYVRKLSTKIRVINKRLKKPWDGYYYFGISNNLYKLLLESQNKKGRKRKKFTFHRIILYKLLEECKIREYSKTHIYRIPYASDFGYCKFVESLTTDKAELIIERDPLKFNDILINNNNYNYGRKTNSYEYI